jgi:lipid-A-disaccharide synthase
MKYYIIAGERSGDLHGSNLVKAMLRINPTATFRGFGGDEMQNAGVQLVMHYDQLAFMGFQAVVNFMKIAKYMKECKADIQEYKPDALILIDYGGFNRRIATFGKLLGIKVLYYIPPKVWAWRQGRAWQLKRDVDRMFVILPFEKAFFKKYDYEVDYVGNPVLDAIKSFVPNLNFLKDNNLSAEKKIVAFLPGSRTMELKMIVPLMAEVAKRNPELQYVVAAVDNLSPELYQPLKELSNVKFVYNSTYDLLTHAQAAIVTSGTATLETALFKVPQVVVYKAGSTEYFIAKSFIKVRFISLVNLIADKEVVRELIQSNANVESVGRELQDLLQDQPYREKMIAEYNQLYKTLDIGSASENTAKLILDIRFEI